MESDRPRRQGAPSAVHLLASLQPFPCSDGLRGFCPFLRSFQGMVWPCRTEKRYTRGRRVGNGSLLDLSLTLYGPASEGVGGMRSMRACPAVTPRLCSRLCTSSVTWSFLWSPDHSWGNLKRGVQLKKISYPTKVNVACV